MNSISDERLTKKIAGTIVQIVGHIVYLVAIGYILIGVGLNNMSPTEIALFLMIIGLRLGQD